MAQQTRTTVKTYFQTGDTPTEAQFIDLIDSALNITDDTTDDITEGTAKFTTAADISKLAAIEASADVTDAVNVGSSMTGATAKTTPVDADTMPLNDSAAANVLKKVTWANIKATLKTYFDSLTTTLTNKTITAAANTLTIASTDLTDTASIALLTASQTLTNKTITAAANTLTLASTDLSDTASIALLTASQTLTNKTIAYASNTLSGLPVAYGIACSDETTALTTGTAKATFRMPHAMTVTDVRATLTTAGTGAALVTVDINDSGTTILGTKLTIDATEKTSTTAATPAVISDSALADDAEITIDIDTIDTGGVSAGLKVWLIGVRA